MTFTVCGLDRTGKFAPLRHPGVSVEHVYLLSPVHAEISGKASFPVQHETGPAVAGTASDQKKIIYMLGVSRRIKPAGLLCPSQ